MKVDRNDEAKTGGIGERENLWLKYLHGWKEWDLKCKSRMALVKNGHSSPTGAAKQDR